MSADSAQPGECVAAFRTSRRKRAACIVWAATIGVAALFLSLAVAAVTSIVATTFGMPWPMAIGCGLIASLLFARFALKMLVAPLRFQVRFEQDRVALGGGWIKRTCPYDDVEVIWLPAKRDREHGVGLECGGKGTFIYLSAADEAFCVRMLQKWCKNAIFVDSFYREQFPPGAHRPSLTLNVLCRRYRGRAINAAFLAALAVLVGVGMGVRLYRHFWGGGPVLSLVQLVHVFTLLGAVVIGLCETVRRVRKNWRNLRAVERTLETLGREWQWDGPPGS
jgi:hypothetical protein